MSEREEEVPELDADAKAFLARHAQTGEPSPESLARVGAKLTAPVPAPEGKPATVTRLPARRPLLPPEVKAAAAVVILLLGAQALYLALRERTEAPAPAEVKVAQDGPKQADAQLEAVTEAWRAGDFEGARRLAAKECNSAACGALSGELAEMLELANRVDELSDDELGRLGAFDKKLSNGRDSALRRRLENARQRPPPPPPTAEALARAEQLFKEASEEKRAKNFESAVIRLEKCIDGAPGFHPCYRLLGSVYASIATRDQSAYDMEKARDYYERFLDIAPPNDEYVPKVTAILEAASDGSEPRRRELPSERPPPGQPVKDGDSIRVGLGTQVVLQLDTPISRVAVGDPSTADVKTAIGNSRLLVIGLSEGKTTVLIWDANNRRTTLEVEVFGATEKKPETRTVTLVAGGHTTVTFEANIARVALGDPQVADIKPLGGRELRIDGLRKGKTTVLAWFTTGGRTSITVEVTPSNDPDDKVQDLFMRATMARGSGDYVESKRLLLEILRIDPQNESASRMLLELRGMARDLYLRGYQLKESDPKAAVRLFRQVVELTPSDDETHQKAKSRIAELTSR